MVIIAKKTEFNNFQSPISRSFTPISREKTPNKNHFLKNSNVEELSLICKRLKIENEKLYKQQRKAMKQHQNISSSLVEENEALKNKNSELVHNIKYLNDEICKLKGEINQRIKRKSPKSKSKSKDNLFEEVSTATPYKGNHGRQNTRTVASARENTPKTESISKNNQNFEEVKKIKINLAKKEQLIEILANKICDLESVAEITLKNVSLCEQKISELTMENDLLKGIAYKTKMPKDLSMRDSLMSNCESENNQTPLLLANYYQY